MGFLKLLHSPLGTVLTLNKPIFTFHAAMVRISTHADSGRLPDLVDNLSVTNLETNVRFACHTTALLMGNMGSRSLCSCYGSPPCRSPKPWIRQIYLRQTKILRHFFGKAIPEMFCETHPIGYITLDAKRFQAHKGVFHPSPHPAGLIYCIYFILFFARKNK